MILIVGGAASGKRTYARALGYTDADMSDKLDGCPVVYDVQELVFRDPDAAHALLEPLCARAVVICNEVGSGIVPANPFERAGREACGRLMSALAGRAERVVRLVCGIPGDLER